MRIFLKILILAIIIFILEIFFILLFSKRVEDKGFLKSSNNYNTPNHEDTINFDNEDKKIQITEYKPPVVTLFVPYVSEAPEGDWSGDWVNACEEATITMVDAYYRGLNEVSTEDAKKSLEKLFDEEDKLFGSNKNTDSKQIKEIVDNFFDFGVSIKTNPTIGDIKKELYEGRPVISLHFGFDLQNKNIPFSPTLSSYHTIVIVGYDDLRQVFIAHDPGDEEDGHNIYYSYKIIMNSLHDYNVATNKTDGAPTVLFTRKQK